LSDFALIHVVSTLNQMYNLSPFNLSTNKPLHELSMLSSRILNWKHDWLFDSKVTSHMCHNQNLFINMQPCTYTMKTAIRVDTIINEISIVRLVVNNTFSIYTMCSTSQPSPSTSYQSVQSLAKDILSLSPVTVSSLSDKRTMNHL
jgi:hypothetical protein